MTTIELDLNKIMDEVEAALRIPGNHNVPAMYEATKAAILRQCAEGTEVPYEVVAGCVQAMYRAVDDGEDFQEVIVTKSATHTAPETLQ